jgi:hypothetical protein
MEMPFLGTALLHGLGNGASAYVFSSMESVYYQDVFSGNLSSLTLSPCVYVHCTVYSVWRGRVVLGCFWRSHTFTFLKGPDSESTKLLETKRFCIAFYESSPSSRNTVYSKYIVRDIYNTHMCTYTV